MARQKSENGFWNAVKRVAIGGVLTFLTTLLIAMAFKAFGGLVGLGIGPDDVMNLSIYGFVVGCVCWGIRAKPIPAAIATGLTSGVVIVILVLVLGTVFSSARNPHLLSKAAMAATVYGIIGAASGFSSGCCYLYTKRNYEAVLL